MTSIINRLSFIVVPYIGTWIETAFNKQYGKEEGVVPYIGTWIETVLF